MGTNGESAYDQGVDAYSEERYEEAVEHYLLYLKSNPEDEDTLFNLACAYVKTGEIHHAKNIVKSLIVANPQIYDEVIQENDLQPVHDFASDVTENFGIKGWLLFFILSALYIQPTIFVFTTFFEFVSLLKMSSNPFAFLLFFLLNGIGALFALKWIFIGGRLKKLQPTAVQETNLWLAFTLTVTIVVAVILFAIGSMNNVIMITVVLQGIILIAWMQYFKTSIRVKIMYSGWWISNIPKTVFQWSLFDSVRVSQSQPS